jgi:hypothetical protein
MVDESPRPPWRAIAPVSRAKSNWRRSPRARTVEPDAPSVTSMDLGISRAERTALGMSHVPDCDVVRASTWGNTGCQIDAHHVRPFTTVRPRGPGTILVERLVERHTHQAAACWIARISSSCHGWGETQDARAFVMQVVVTAGAALSHMDLALWLTRQHNRKDVCGSSYFAPVASGIESCWTSTGNARRPRTLHSQ